MGGRLERTVDEVSELVTSRPAWMAADDPATFSQEQLRQYKEYQAKEAAAIEERLKRKGIMVRCGCVHTQHPLGAWLLALLRQRMCTSRQRSLGAPVVLVCVRTQETELRTLKSAAEEVASRFDAAVAALAAKRLDVLAEVRVRHRTLACVRHLRKGGQAPCVHAQASPRTSHTGTLCMSH